MKKLLTILLLLFFYVSVKSQATGPFNGTNWKDSATLIDDGWYSGFPIINHANGNQAGGILRSSTSHASPGPMIYVKTVDGGINWSKDTITFNGVPVNLTLNYSTTKKGVRVVVGWRGTDSLIRIGHNDIGTHDFTQTQILDLDTDSFLVYPSPIKMVNMPSGKIYFVFYTINKFGGRTTALIYESSDGETFVFKCQIYSHNSILLNATLGDWRGNEIAIGITHNTGIDSTCKMIAILRTQVGQDGGVYPMFFYSENGGATWAKDLVNRDAGSFVDDNGTTVTNNSPGFSRHLLYSFLPTNSPYDIIPFQDSVYVICGERSRVGGNKDAAKFIAATPDGAFRNKFSDWTRPRQIGSKFRSATSGSTTDAGYDNWFVADNGLYTAEYDVSPLAAIPGKSAKRILSRIRKVK